MFKFTKSIAISEYNLREQTSTSLSCRENTLLLHYIIQQKKCIQFQNNLDSNMSTAICALSRAYLKQVIKAHMSFLIRGPIVLPWDLLLCSFALRRLTQSYTSVFWVLLDLPYNTQREGIYSEAGGLELFLLT